MCGICGLYNFRDHSPVNQDLIQRMTNTMTHRGPDDEGYFFHKSLGLGFKRLSIIDLQGGHQPMSDQDESVWIIFNGEIYNYLELRRELTSFGHVFQTNSDTEVIIYGYKQWGEAVFNRLNGMFGLAIWDVNKKKLILARDAMGIKIVYYKLENGTLLFGSEIRAILVANDRTPNVDASAVNLFFRYRYTPSPLTLFKGINKLAPGTMLVLKDGSHHIKRWYDYRPEPFSPMPSAEQAKEELLEIYKNAIRRQLISDVPVGLLLSGGIDSGLLLALMSISGGSWPTYSIGYGQDFKGDELLNAAKTAEIYSARHTSIQISRESFEANFAKIMRFLEEPVTTSSIVPMYFVCERARQDVKVALIGQGPDELFGGYRRHLGIQYGDYWRKLPEWIHVASAALIKGLPRNELLKRGLYSLNIPDRMKRYQQVFSILPGESIDSLFQEGLLPANVGDLVLEYWTEIETLIKNTDELGGFQCLEIRSALPDELLMHGDKMSMAHSLEVRVPYLDKEIVEYVERLKAGYKIKKVKGKWIHRQICNDFLPKAILRRKKLGFATNVVDSWFQKSMNSKMKDHLLDESSLMFQYLRPKPVKKLLDDHIAGKNDNYKILFSIVAFEEWLRTFMS